LFFSQSAVFLEGEKVEPVDGQLSVLRRLESAFCVASVDIDTD
jgi:hypothetical protein